MCAITGIFDTRGNRPIDEALLRAMNLRQRHRGPDGEGYHAAPGIGLGHCRLSIIDLPGGGQPQYNEDRSVAVVFNGEIYNFRALRMELQARGHRFATMSDTEVIVHGWEEWREGCVEHFDGMFSFAVWDGARSTLFLARDRFGVKPLFYSFIPDGLLVFASELKALLAHPGVVRKIDPCAIEEYLTFGYVAEPRSILHGTDKLLPGHSLSITRGGAPVLRKYWQLSFDPRSALSEDEAADELVERLRHAVKARLVADVPLGAFLSGGVDSSAVVALMAEAASAPVTTCSIAFTDRSLDESPYAALVADRYRTSHHVETVAADDRLSADDVAAIFDEPFADSSAIPTCRVSQIARQHVTVALSGDGGDESLGGYRRYPMHVAHERIRRAVPPLMRSAMFSAAGMLSRAALHWSAMPGQVTSAALSADGDAGYLELIAIARTPLRRELFSKRLLRDIQGYRAADVFRRHAADAPVHSPLARAQYLDLMTYLPGDILTKVDRASMLYGLEVRSPFLDHHLIEWVSRLPDSFKLRGTEGKCVLKRALRQHLPGEILNRKKSGFAVPLAAWLRGPLRDAARRAVNSTVLHDTGYFERQTLERLMREHEMSRRDNASIIWAVMIFDAFLRRLAGEPAWAC